MLRIIIRTDSAQMAVNVGGAVYTNFRTFDVSLPEVEAALDSGGRNEDGSFEHTQVVGVEIIRPEPKE